MDILLLQKFLLDSNQAGYATGEEKQWIKEADGSTTIPYQKGEFRSNDNFFGGEPYGGRLIVFHGDKPVWMMVYYGWVAEGVQPDPVYAILRNALKQMPEEAPFRGPKDYSESNLHYRNLWQGELEKFSGEEIISDGEKILYKANYFGGLVDQRTGV